MLKIIYIFIAIAILAGIVSVFTAKTNNIENLDSDYDIEKDVTVETEDKSDLIKVQTPLVESLVSSPLNISGEARGNWFFEASFPVVLVDWDGVVVAEGVAEAQGEWMTESFVPFVASLEFINPYNSGDPDFMKKGTLILRKDNPSGLPENDDALEIPIKFAP